VLPMREYFQELALSVVNNSKMRWYHHLSPAINVVMPVREHDPDVSVSRSVEVHMWWYQQLSYRDFAMLPVREHLARRAVSPMRGFTSGSIIDLDTHSWSHCR
jgi:hypothetical protein